MGRKRRTLIEYLRGCLRNRFTNRQTLAFVAVSFVLGVMASVLGNFVTNAFDRIITALRGIDLLAWLDVAIIPGRRWLWGDLALSIISGLIAVVLVTLVRFVGRMMQPRSRQLPASAVSEPKYEEDGFRSCSERVFVRVPRVVGLPVGDAERAITDAGLYAKTVWDYGPGPNALGIGLVYEQSPEGSETMSPDSIVRIYSWMESQ